MSRKNLLISAIVIIVAVIGVIYWQANKKNVEKMGLENSDQIFDIKAPADFDSARLERLEEKITNAKNLYNTKKDETWTWITIGNMYEFAHDYDRAIGAYQKSASLNESEYISRMNLAYLYENQKKDYVKAEEFYKKVVELNSGNPEQHINLARLYEFKMSKQDDAEKIYTTGLEKTSNNPDMLVATIRFFERQNHPEKVKEYAGLLLKLYPDNGAYKNDFGALVK